MKKRHVHKLSIIPIILLFFTSSFIYSQTGADSLDVALLDYSSDISKVDFLFGKAKEYQDKDTTKTFVFINKSIEISNRAKLYSKLGYLYKFVGDLYMNIGLGKHIEENYFKSYDNFKLAGDSIGVSKIYNNIGIYSNEWQNDYPKALKYFEKSLRIKELYSNTDGIFIESNYYHLGKVYKNLNDYGKSLLYLFKTLPIVEKENNSNRISDVNHEIAEVYFSLEYYDKSNSYLLKNTILKDRDQYSIANDLILKSKTLFRRDSIDLAFEKLENAREIYLKLNDIIGLGKVYNCMSLMYNSQKDYDKQLHYVNLAKEIFQKTESLYELSFVNNQLGIVLFEKGDLESSEKSLNKSLEISDKRSFLNISKRNYLYLAKISYFEKDFVSAYKEFEMFSKLKDSIFSLKKFQIISRVEDKYNIDEKELELNELTKVNGKLESEIDRSNKVSNYLKLIVILILLILSLLFFVYYTNSRQNHKLEYMVEERTKELKEANILLTNSKKNTEDSSRIKLDLLKNISELFKAPISELENMLLILKNENEDNIELYEQLEILSSSVLRLNGIIGSVTDIYNIEDDKIDLKPEYIELFTIITDIVDRRKDLAESRCLKLNFTNDGVSSSVNQDKEMVYRVINQILNTVLDYSNRGDVDILLSENYNNQEIKINSSNFTINERIFNADLSTNRKDNKQSNLDRMFVSLFLVRKILEQIGGSVSWLKTDSKDGISFIIQLPLLVAEK